MVCSVTCFYQNRCAYVFSSLAQLIDCRQYNSWQVMLPAALLCTEHPLRMMLG